MNAKTISSRKDFHTASRRRRRLNGNENPKLNFANQDYGRSEAARGPLIRVRGVETNVHTYNSNKKCKSNVGALKEKKKRI